MATITRQPFAPLDEARLQSLTSLKNRQNSVSSPAGKRKVERCETDDSENVDPLLFAKRAKVNNSSNDVLKKPVNFFLTPSTTVPASAAPEVRSPNLLSPPKAAFTFTPRRTLQPKSPLAKLNTRASKPTPTPAPAGRSPTRGKKVGLLSSRRRTGGPFTRVDPPSFNLGSAAAPFSLDAALKGTIPSYTPKPSAAKHSPLDDKADLKAGWFFDIHEDTPEQEMTNLLQHSTCVLDISSDEESEQKARRERDEGRDKENVPPLDDVSQTSSRRSRVSEDDMVVEKERVALGEMNTADYYSEGCDETSIVLVPADEELQPQRQAVVMPKQQSTAPPVQDYEFAFELKSERESPSTLEADLDALMGKQVTEQSSTLEADIDALMGKQVTEPSLMLEADIDASMGKQETETLATIETDIDALMGKQEEGNGKAAVLQPIEGTGESFELWESGTDGGETAL